MWLTYDGENGEGWGRKRRTKARAMDAAAFARTRLGFVPDAKQEEVLRSNAKRGILNCSRQWGKSTVAAIKAVHRAYTRPECLVLVVSPGERQSAEFLRKAARLVRRLGIPARGDGDHAISLMLPNGSRIIGLPGNGTAVRGFSDVSLILIDEASRVSDEMYRSLRPMLAVGDGDLWLMSTPCGQRGFFYEAWRDRGEDWMRVCVPATACSRIHGKFLKQERRIMGEASFSQEYLGMFVADERTVFDPKLLEAALDDSVTELKIDGR